MREKTALVTGAARGIGAAISDRFRKLGARVLEPSRNDLDLSSDVSVDGFLSRLGEPIDVLVNNAGINIPAGLSDITKEAIDDTLRANLIGPIHLIRGVVPAMKERRYGPAWPRHPGETSVPCSIRCNNCRSCWNIWTVRKRN